MNEEYDNSILDNKENTLFTSSLIHVIGSPHYTQIQRGNNSNENESINYENQQSIYEVLNKYSFTKIKNPQN